MPVDCQQLAATIEADEAILANLYEQQADIESQISEVEQRLLDEWLLWDMYCSGGMAAAQPHEDKLQRIRDTARRLARLIRAEEGRRRNAGDDS